MIFVAFVAQPISDRLIHVEKGHVPDLFIKSTDNRTISNWKLWRFASHKFFQSASKFQ